MVEAAISVTTALGRHVVVRAQTREGIEDRFWSPRRTAVIARRREGEVLVEDLTKLDPLTDGVPTAVERLLVTDRRHSISPDHVDLSILVGKRRIKKPGWRGSWSCGAATHWTHLAGAEAEQEDTGLLGIGEGGVHPTLRPFGTIIVPQLASGHFVRREDLEVAAVIEDKYSQNSKAGRPGARRKKWSKKREQMLAAIRGLPANLPVILSPTNLIISVEEAPARVAAIRDINRNAFLLGKITSTHDLAQRVLQLARAGYDGVIIDSHGGGTASSYAEWRDFCGGFQNVFAARIAYNALQADGRDDFLTVVSGRLVSARDVYWAIRAGAHAVMSATGALAVMDCIMAQNCSEACPTYITTYPPEKLDTPETEARIVAEWTRRSSTYDRVFRTELATYFAQSGFTSVAEARGNFEGVDGDLAEQERILLGLSARKSFYYRFAPSDGSAVQERRDRKKRATGRAADGAMGTAADLQSKQDTFAAFGARIPRHLTGPANDFPREPNDTRTTVGSLRGWGGIVLKQSDPVGEYFGIPNLDEVRDPLITITSEASFDAALAGLEPDRKTVLLINGPTSDDKLALLAYVDEKLRDTVRAGTIMRNSVSLLVEGDHLRPRELTVYACKGADAVVLDLQGTEAERRNLLSAVVEQECNEFMSAMGLNSRAALVGASELIAASPVVSREQKVRWGVKWFGE